MADKKGAALLIGMPGGGPMDGEPDGDEGGGDAPPDDKREAMSAFIDAIHAKDVDAALTAYESLCDQHMADAEAPPEQ